MRRWWLAELVRRSRVEWAIALLLALSLAGVWTLTLSVVTHVQHQGVAGAAAEVRGFAQILAREWGTRLQRIAWLQDLAGPISEDVVAGRPPPPRALAALRAAIAASAPGVVQVSAMDAAGNVIWSNLPMPPERVNLAQREHYLAIARDGHDSFIGRPVKGAVSGRWTIQFSRAVRGPDRELLAIDVVSVDMDILKPLAAALNEVGKGVVSVVRADGVIMARSQDPGIGDFIPLFRTVATTILRNGATDARLVSPVDGVARFYSGRRIGESEMVLLAGLDEAVRLASVRAFSADIRRSAAIVSLVLIALAATLETGVIRSRNLAKTRERLEEIARREALLRQIAEQATDMIGVLDAGLRTIYVNQASRWILGVPPEALIGQRFGHQVEALDEEVLQATLDRLVGEGGAQRVTVRVRHATDGTRWVESEIVATEAPDSNAAGTRRYIAITRDVTARMQIEDDLRQAQRQVEGLLRLGPGLLYRLTLTPDGNTLRSFPAANKPLLDYSWAEAEQPGHLEGLLCTADAGRLRVAIGRCVADAHAVVEYEVCGRSGTPRRFRDEMRTAGWEGGRAIIVGYLTDITEEHQTRLRLQQAERLANLGNLTAGIAHEISQPLAVIGIAADNGRNLLERGNAAGVAGKLERIKLQVARIRDVIAHVRQLGRDDGADAAPVVLAEVVRNALAQAESRLQANGVRCDVDLPPGLPRPLAVGVLLEQVLINLIVNACDAYRDRDEWTAAAGSQRLIRITARHAGEEVVLMVTDEAGGIPEDALPFIFEPFFTTKPAAQGTGLGLAIALATIAKMGGRISASNTDLGAAFEIVLPVRPAGRARRRRVTAATPA
jgi:PAS domain S-box-containing protein